MYSPVNKINWTFVTNGSCNAVTLAVSAVSGYYGFVDVESYECLTTGQTGNTIAGTLSIKAKPNSGGTQITTSKMKIMMVQGSTSSDCKTVDVVQNAAPCTCANSDIGTARFSTQASSGYLPPSSHASSTQILHSVYVKCHANATLSSSADWLYDLSWSSDTNTHYIMGKYTANPSTTETRYATITIKFGSEVCRTIEVKQKPAYCTCSTSGFKFNSSNTTAATYSISSGGTTNLQVPFAANCGSWSIESANGNTPNFTYTMNGNEVLVSAPANSTASAKSDVMNMVLTTTNGLTYTCGQLTINQPAGCSCSNVSFTANTPISAAYTGGTYTALTYSKTCGIIRYEIGSDAHGAISGITDNGSNRITVTVNANPSTDGRTATINYYFKVSEDSPECTNSGSVVVNQAGAPCNCQHLSIGTQNITLGSASGSTASTSFAIDCNATVSLQGGSSTTISGSVNSSTNVITFKAMTKAATSVTFNVLVDGVVCTGKSITVTKPKDCSSVTMSVSGANNLTCANGGTVTFTISG
jgi:hypothetical protein